MGCGGSKVTPGVVENNTTTTTNNTATTVPTSSSAKKLPPLSPPKKSKDQLIPDPTIFTEVDDFVAKLPKSSATSVETLARCLTEKFPDDIRKTRALFTWMALNVSYDVESYFSGQHQPQDANSVLQSGKAVCQGYSQLFDALCGVIGLPCVVVTGIAKGYSHDPENVYTANTETNHAWNLVLIQGEWRPLESTWGAGFLDSGRQFNRRFDHHWFLTDPQQFVLQHFPLMNSDLKESEKYQLLKKPMTIEAYSAHLKLQGYAQSVGLQCLTHPNTVINVQGDVTIKIKTAPQQPLQSVKVTMEERGSASAVSSSADVLTWLDDDAVCSMYVRPSRPGTFLLQAFGRVKGQDDGSNTLQHLFEHVIRCQKPEANAEPFPDKFGVWGLQNPTARDCGLSLGPASKDKKSLILDNIKDKPFLYTAARSEVTVPILFPAYVTLSVKLTHARDKDAQLKTLTFIQYTERGATIRARLPKKGFYHLMIFSSKPDSEQGGSLEYAADLLLYSDCDFPGVPSPFPLAYPTAFKERAQLLSPLQESVPADSPTLYRVLAPSLGKVTVAGKSMEVKNDGVFEAEVAPPDGSDKVTVFGASSENATSLSGLFTFVVTK